MGVAVAQENDDASTGHGLFDAVSRKNMSSAMKKRITYITNPQFMSTANGVIEVNEVTELRIRNFDEVITPFVLESTPDILSVGRRCRELGFDFH